MIITCIVGISLPSRLSMMSFSSAAPDERGFLECFAGCSKRRYFQSGLRAQCSERDGVSAYSCASGGWIWEYMKALKDKDKRRTGYHCALCSSIQWYPVLLLLFLSSRATMHSPTWRYWSGDINMVHSEESVTLLRCYLRREGAVSGIIVETN